MLDPRFVMTRELKIASGEPAASIYRRHRMYTAKPLCLSCYQRLEVRLNSLFLKSHRNSHRFYIILEAKIRFTYACRSSFCLVYIFQREAILLSKPVAQFSKNRSNFYGKIITEHFVRLHFKKSIRKGRLGKI